MGSAVAGGLFGVAAGAPFWLTAGLLLVGVVVGSGVGRRLPEREKRAAGAAGVDEGGPG